MTISYRAIDGIHYREDFLAEADQAVQGRGDGRISLDDARKLADLIISAASFTALEKMTIAYIREHYNWTDEADAWFRDRVAEWARAHRF